MKYKIDKLSMQRIQANSAQPKIKQSTEHHRIG